MKDNSSNITGSLMNAFIICRRKAWFLSREISPYQENDLLEIGKLIGEDYFKREKKEILLNNMKIDFVKNDNKHLIVAEIKKSSAGAEAAKIQIAFYLYQLKKLGIEATGELLVPKERKKEKIILTEYWQSKVEESIEEIQALISESFPPFLTKVSFCKYCAYEEFCFA